VYLQRVPEGKQVKNRVHLDLFVADAALLISELEALGARVLGEPQTGSEGGWWQVMADPAGNEFCVCLERRES
jgi:predicted enzyme related to lactoylglutathione lyase